MNGTSNTEPPAEPQGERLTLSQARNSLVVLLCLALFLSAFGLHLFFEGKKFLAGTCCLGELAISALLPAVLKQYRLVKSGAIVTVHSKASSQIFRIQPTVAIVVTSLLTLVVLIMGGVTLYILLSNPLSRMVSIQAFLVGINLLLWLLIGFLWYGIAMERRKITVVEPLYEQGEGVWPPAPQIPKNE